MSKTKSLSPETFPMLWELAIGLLPAADFDMVKAFAMAAEQMRALRQTLNEGGLPYGPSPARVLTMNADGELLVTYED